MWLRVLAALAFACATAASAQTPPPITAPAQHRAVAEGILVDIEIAEPVSTRTHLPGGMFAIRLAEPIRLDGEVVVPAGVTGQGQIVDAGRAGILGKPAKLVLAARYLDWNGRRIPLRAFRWSATGVDRDGMVTALALVPYAGVLSIFIHGGEIDVPVGARAQAKLAAELAPDLPLSPQSAAPASTSPTPEGTPPR
jgi:hypothetical protein